MLRDKSTRLALEADFVLGDGQVAIEVKGSSRVERKELRPLMAFKEEYKPRQKLVVCNERVERIHDDIRILPWRVFLRELWDGRIIH